MNSYCPAPWMSAEITADGISPCCWYYPIASTQQFSNVPDVLNSDEFKDIRKKMLAGEEIKNCSQCYQLEKYGIESKRKILLREYGHVTDVKLKYLFLCIDNLCNLKCRGCNSGASHLWYNDELELYGTTYSPKKYSSLELSNVDQFTNLEFLEISGGEPLYSKKVEDFLTLLTSRQLEKNINFVLITNGTVKPNENVLKFMLDSKSLSVAVSIDGVGDLNDYFRSGSNFSTVLETAKYFYSFSDLRDNVTFQIITTASVYNINELKNIEKLILEQFPKAHWMIKLLEYPTHASIINLPSDYKKTLLDLMEDWGDRYEHLRDALKQTGSEEFSHFINFHESLDNMRNEICPNQLLNDYIDNYKKINPKVDSKTFFIKHINSLNK